MPERDVIETLLSLRGGAVQAIRVEDSYRGMASVLPDMNRALQKCVAGHAAPFGDGILFDEYCKWCDWFYSNTMDPVFLVVNGIVQMSCGGTGVAGSMSFIHYKCIGADELVVMEEMTKSGLVSVDEAVRLEKLMDDYHGRPRPVPLPHELDVRNSSTDHLDKLSRDESPENRMAVAMHPQTMPYTLMRLSKDPDWRVRMAVAMSGNVLSGNFVDVSIMRKRLLNDENFEVRTRMAAGLVNQMMLYARSPFMDKFGWKNRLSRDMLACEDETLKSLLAVRMMEVM